jgi:VanZ family protein
MKIWSIPVIWLLLITIGSILPGKTLPTQSWNIFDNFDKLLHFLAYMGFILLVGWANFKEKKLNKKQLLIVVFITAVYSSLIEGVQWLMYVDRYFEVFDILANITGLFAGYWISVKFLKTKKDGI